MKYELLKDSCEGIIIDSTPVLRDIKDTFEVSFLLPNRGAYIAIFKDENEIEYEAAIKNSAVKVPKQLLAKEQIVRLRVCEIDDERILRSWECWSIRIGAFLHMRKQQWHIAAAEKDILARLGEIEKENSAQKAEIASVSSETNQQAGKLEQELKAQTAALASLKESNAKLAMAYNKSIEVINDLSKRVAAVEKNYDPTLIK